MTEEQKSNVFCFSLGAIATIAFIWFIEDLTDFAYEKGFREASYTAAETMREALGDEDMEKFISVLQGHTDEETDPKTVLRRSDVVLRSDMIGGGKSDE